ncbi:SDR family NAD(P)-dependent oxidoreductase [Allomuricauda sp. SCSIO 65647]|uniref:SDR family NAD(P)-dependent oxidoreductase n=1 Tax=Allomuricauda sp. SCSIO 65647 TaxID=2908843 RepID=UPI001F387309|nr:glucose 1-dehydrogenase [Muricauda sp. SCSIO 65647]UJH68777.1 glucose 1-dehydrogenase [Muricauda sp. SCSIO 65647]
MTSFDYSGKTVIVTGGGSGIGKALSKRFALGGAKVYILEFKQENGRQVEKEINDEGGTAHYYHCDVADHEQVKKVVGAIILESQIDILVNNAGIAHIGNIEATTENDMDKLYQVNIKGIYNCIHACISNMKQQGHGIILNMASIASSVGISDRFAYSMTKGAALTMTYSVAKDYVDFGIRCNSISPARVHTPFVDGFLNKNYPGKEKEMFEKLSKTQPIGRMATPDEVAHLALYLCSDEAAFITGTDFPIDGGFIKLNG